jgi:two-component system NtrC family sensor kinase
MRPLRARRRFSYPLMGGCRPAHKLPALSCVFVVRRASRFVSKLPLRVRFALAVAAIAGGVMSALWALGAGIGDRQPQATLWFAASAVLLVTLLVDQAAWLLVYRRLAAIRLAMQRAAAGDLTVRATVDGLDEIGVVARGMNDILQGLERLNAAADVRVNAATALFRQKSAEIADSHREMAVLSEELARAGRLAALGQAAANMAHQIGTPLNLISTHVQLLIQSTSPAADSIDRLKAIQDQVAKVTAVVRGALDSLRPSAVPHERADLGVLVRRVCQIAGPMLEDAGIEIDVITPGQPMELLADPVQLELALLNLLTNSVDAMPTGGTLTVRLDGVEGRLRLAIADTGTGIPPELVPQIFDPWVTTKGHDKGTGLGLSIARQVVASHGGSISVDNRPGAGAVFTIDLPAVPDRLPAPDVAHAENSRHR